MSIYFFLAGALLLYGISYKANLSNRRKRNYILIAFGILTLVAALRSPEVGRDLASHYAKRYEMIGSYSWEQIPEFSVLTGYELGYCYYTKILNFISPNVQFFIAVTSIIIYGITGYFIYKKSSDVVMSTELFMLMCVYYMYMNILRQSLAISIVLVGYLLFDKHNRNKKGYIEFILMILLASTFHNSALLCFIMLLLDKIKFTGQQMLISTGAFIVAYIFYFKIYEFALVFLGRDNYERYLTSATEGVGNMNMQSIALLFLTAGAFVLAFYVFVLKTDNKPKSIQEQMVDRDTNFMLHMGLMAILCRALLFRMNIINRASYYFIPFVLLLYPNAIKKFSLRNDRIILRVGIYCAFIFYFVLITVLYADQFYGAVPYHFYWE